MSCVPSINAYVATHTPTCHQDDKVITHTNQSIDPNIKGELLQDMHVS